jgi:hypothetical protein
MNMFVYNLCCDFLLHEYAFQAPADFILKGVRNTPRSGRHEEISETQTLTLHCSTVEVELINYYITFIAQAPYSKENCVAR